MTTSGYALDLLTPVRYVATALDGVSPEALSVAELADGYTHFNPGDISRVKEHEHRDDVSVFLVEAALKALGSQVSSDEDGRWRLAKPFGELKHLGRKVRPYTTKDDADEKRELRAALHEDRMFHVAVVGAKGGTKERALRLHPLAKALPMMGQKKRKGETTSEFDQFVVDVRRHGVLKPILVMDDFVLDGRHRVAVADAFSLPVRVEEFTGTEEQARDRVMSENVHRRHLTTAQRGLIVREMFLPEAKAEAERRVGGRPAKDSGKPTAEMRQVNRGPTAAELAVKASSGLATVRTVETMAPVDDAPQTADRVRRGEITTAAEARREAIKETGSAEPEKLPVVQPRSAYDRLGCALGDVRSATETLDSGAKGDIPTEKMRDRIHEIRSLLNQAEELARDGATCRDDHSG